MRTNEPMRAEVGGVSIRKAFLFVLCVWMMASGAAATTVPAVSPALPEAPPAAVLEGEYLDEVMQHLYRWYLDEVDLEDEELDALRIPFWVRPMTVAHDAGDQSEFAEIFIPSVDIIVKVKRADYRIEETGQEVKGTTFRIFHVAREVADGTQAAPEGWTVVERPVREMLDHLRRTFLDRHFPDDAMLAQLKAAVRRHFQMEPDTPVKYPELILHAAPLSPVANECWIYEENSHLLLRFSSDLDIENSALQSLQNLQVRTFDTLRQTVVSLDEAPGSNFYMTRDQIGRALFNCLVLGRRTVVSITPPAP